MIIPCFFFIDRAVFALFALPFLSGDVVDLDGPIAPPMELEPRALGVFLGICRFLLLDFHCLQMGLDLGLQSEPAGQENIAGVLHRQSQREF